MKYHGAIIQISIIAISICAPAKNSALWVQVPIEPSLIFFVLGLCSAVLCSIYSQE